MARDTIPTYSASPAGQTVTYLAATAANNALVENNGRVVLIANNATGGSLNVTVVTGGTVGGLAIADQVIAVAAGATRLLGPFPVDTFNQPGTSTLHVDVSGNMNLAALNT